LDSVTDDGITEFVNVTVAGHAPLLTAVARVCADVPVNHSDCELVDPAGMTAVSVRGVPDPHDPAVDATVVVNTLLRYGKTILFPTAGAVNAVGVQITPDPAVTEETPLYAPLFPGPEPWNHPGANGLFDVEHMMHTGR
jgi:hypothetical protein